MEDSKNHKSLKIDITEETFTVSNSLINIEETYTINTNAFQAKEKILAEAFKFHSKGNILEAERYYQYFIKQGFTDYRVFSNYGTILSNFGKLKDAEIALRKAIKIKPDFADAHSNLGYVLTDLGKLKDAEISVRKAIELNPDFAQAHNNLGIILTEIDQLNNAEFSIRKAIQIKADYAEAHNNLGIILLKKGEFKDAEKTIRQAIELKPNFADAHSNLGHILHNLGELERAESSARKAIEIDPVLATAHLNLGNILRDLGKLKDAEISFCKAIKLSPDWKSYYAYASCLYKYKKFNEAKKNLKQADFLSNKLDQKNLIEAAIKSVDLKDKKEDIKKFTRLILHRPVEKELISYLYSLKNKQLNLTTDARYGNGLCSKDFELFQSSSPIIKKLSKELRNICKEALGIKDIFFAGTFFNIFVSGSGATPHSHLKVIDKEFNLSLNKYSLVYYLDVGDQSGLDPGILNLYEPPEEILPTNGMIIIIKANKTHSVSYHGSKDRVMVGLNFYGF